MPSGWRSVVSEESILRIIQPFKALCVILPATASNPDKEILYIQCKKKELKGTTDQHYLLDEKQLHLLSKSEQ